MHCVFRFVSRRSPEADAPLCAWETEVGAAASPLVPVPPMTRAELQAPLTPAMHERIDAYQVACVHLAREALRVRPEGPGDRPDFSLYCMAAGCPRVLFAAGTWTTTTLLDHVADRPELGARSVHWPAADAAPTLATSIVLPCAAPECQRVVIQALRDDMETVRQTRAVHYHRSCVQCRRLAPRMPMCTGCHLVYYCSQACQQAHWPRHKAICQATLRD